MLRCRTTLSETTPSTDGRVGCDSCVAAGVLHDVIPTTGDVETLLSEKIGGSYLMYDADEYE